MTDTSRPSRRGLIARLLRLDARQRHSQQLRRLDNHLRTDLGLAPHEARPRNPYIQGW